MSGLCTVKARPVDRFPGLVPVNSSVFVPVEENAEINKQNTARWGCCRGRDGNSPADRPSIVGAAEKWPLEFIKESEILQAINYHFRGTWVVVMKLVPRECLD
jgi:hypothetical protein